MGMAATTATAAIRAKPVRFRDLTIGGKLAPTVGSLCMSGTGQVLFALGRGKPESPAG
jgi:hypothetical protein